MKTRMLTLAAVTLLLTLGAARAADACPQIVKTALDTADKFCQKTGRNQACYGHIAMEAEPQPGAPNFRFEQEGDIVNVSELKKLQLRSMDEASGEWGVALLRLQANLPDTLPGQNVTFLMFGDVEITDAVEPGDTGLRPMQAFYLRTGIGDSKCDEAPESGLLVQTPQGAGEIRLTINQVDVQLGSTVLFQGDPDSDGRMNVTTIEGAAFLNVAGKQQPVVAGLEANLPARGGGRILPMPAAPAPTPGPSPTPGPTPTVDILSQPSGGGALTPKVVLQAYNARKLRSLPLRLLQRRVSIAPPLTPRQLAEVKARVENNLPLCGVPLFPSCAVFETTPEAALPR
jgi:hypothetical protein